MKYMEYREYKETLDEEIDLLLRGEWSLAKFKSEFSRFYLEVVPGEILSDDEWRFYTTILESLDGISAIAVPFTKPSVGKNDRQYIEWLQKHRQKYLKSQPIQLSLLI